MPKQAAANIQARWNKQNGKFIICSHTTKHLYKDCAIGKIYLKITITCVKMKYIKCYCIDTTPAPPPASPCLLEGNRVVSLVLLGQFIKTYRIFRMVVVTYKFPRWKLPLRTGISYGVSVSA